LPFVDQHLIPTPMTYGVCRGPSISEIMTPSGPRSCHDPSAYRGFLSKIYPLFERVHGRNAPCWASPPLFNICRSPASGTDLGKGYGGELKPQPASLSRCLRAQEECETKGRLRVPGAGTLRGRGLVSSLSGRIPGVTKKMPRVREQSAWASGADEVS